MGPVRRAYVRTLLWLLDEIDPRMSGWVRAFHADCERGEPERIASALVTRARARLQALSFPFGWG
ncbi:MAG TPA: hypothetical protein VK524_22265 [Polyangiaceae bacterium]|nr:hypothetical protein [Polyangiaceae bacterium]